MLHDESLQSRSLRHCQWRSQDSVLGSRVIGWMMDLSGNKQNNFHAEPKYAKSCRAPKQLFLLSPSDARREDMKYWPTFFLASKKFSTRKISRTHKIRNLRGSRSAGCHPTPAPPTQLARPVPYPQVHAALLHINIPMHSIYTRKNSMILVLLEISSFSNFLSL